MTAPTGDRQVVVFSLHGEQYALPVEVVREIVRYTAPRATAAASGLITGMINLRGRVLPVADLSGRLGRRLEVDANTRILVLELANGVLGLIVDTVDGVVRIPAEQVEPLPGGDSGLGEEIVALDDRLVLLLDAERALGGALPARRPARRPRKPPSPPPG